MSAKLLYNLSDENPNLNKQFGCMNGIFQVFYRPHYPARPVSVSGDLEKSLPPGERKDLVGEINMESDKETERITKKKKSIAKDKHRVSSESSSRPSFSSSPRSSSFSSAEVSTAASQFDQPGENVTREQLNAGTGTMFDIKELVKGSINREVRTRREETAAFTQQHQQTSARTSMLLLKEASLRSSNEWNEGRGMAVKFKEGHRLSYDEREMRNNGYKTGSKLKETPRLSLDSRSNSFRSPGTDAGRSSCSPDEPVTMSHRRSNSSVVAKLMGLEVIADNFDTEQRNDNRFCDSPRPMSRVEPTSLQRSRSVGSIKKIPASKFPLEPAPWKQMKAGDAAQTVYGDIQKRLTQLEFKKAGKDLRALKQILEAMEKTHQLMDGSRDNTTLMQSTHQPAPAATSPAMNFKKPSSIVKTKAAAPVSTSLLPQNAALLHVNVGSSRQIRKVTSGKQSAMDLTPRPGLYKGQLDTTKSTSPKTLRSRQALVADSRSITKSGRSQQQSVSPRRQPKKLGVERKSPPTTPISEPCNIQRQLGRQQMESASPRRKHGIKPGSTLQQPDERLSNASSDLKSLRTDSNISLGLNVDDIEVTSRHRLERKNCDFPELHTPKQRSPDFGIKQDRPSLKPLKVNVEQPSPVSVLDAAFEEDDSPSPVRKISLSFKEDNALRSEESVWTKKPAGVCRSIILPDPTHPDSDLLTCFSEEDANFKSGDHKYISEILLASGLLRDLEYSMISIQLNKARLPINPGLFFILEQNNASNMMTLLDNKHRVRRKLIFDTVNEILAQRFTAEGCTKQQVAANPTTTMEKMSKGEQLLKTLCVEIDRLQENNSQCILEDDKEDLIWNDLQCQGMNMKEFEGQTPGIVLDIERMIFRDLINEVCFC